MIEDAQRLNQKHMRKYFIDLPHALICCYRENKNYIAIIYIILCFIPSLQGKSRMKLVRPFGRALCNPCAEDDLASISAHSRQMDENFFPSENLDSE